MSDTPKPKPVTEITLSVMVRRKSDDYSTAVLHAEQLQRQGIFSLREAEALLTEQFQTLWKNTNARIKKVIEDEEQPPF
jgi:hypothetical protein